jgi:hypothetical protein
MPDADSAPAREVRFSHRERMPSDHPEEALMSSTILRSLLGTAFLTCPESRASRPYKEALLATTANTTVLTRAFSGRPAHGLRNGFIDRFVSAGAMIPPYPRQHLLARPMQTATMSRQSPPSPCKQQ